MAAKNGRRAYPNLLATDQSNAGWKEWSMHGAWKEFQQRAAAPCFAPWNACECCDKITADLGGLLLLV